MAESGIFSVLRQDHERHRDLLDKLEDTSGDSEERRALFETFRVDMAAHAAAEEMSLYATMLADPDLRDDAQHSVSEHKELEDIVTELFEMDFSSSGWLTRFRTLKHDYLHHIDEEEQEMFPAAERGLDEGRKKELKAIFAKHKPAERQKAKDNPPDSSEARE